MFKTGYIYIQVYIQNIMQGKYYTILCVCVVLYIFDLKYSNVDCLCKLFNFIFKKNMNSLMMSKVWKKTYEKKKRKMGVVNWRQVAQDRNG